LPLRDYHQRCVQELFALILRAKPSLRPASPESLRCARSHMERHAPNLERLNQFLAGLSPSDNRALIALLGLDRGERQKLGEVANRFQTTSPAIHKSATRALASLRDAVHASEASS
jgi:DNA-directed RNA polymerase specialized sigma24 family protein